MCLHEEITLQNALRHTTLIYSVQPGFLNLTVKIPFSHSVSKKIFLEEEIFRRAKFMVSSCPRLLPPPATTPLICLISDKEQHVYPFLSFPGRGKCPSGLLLPMSASDHVLSQWISNTLLTFWWRWGRLRGRRDRWWMRWWAQWLLIILSHQHHIHVRTVRAQHWKFTAYTHVESRVQCADGKYKKLS